jgi:hypothetical protein
VARLLASPVLTVEQRTALQTLRRQTNPRQLRREIYALRDQLFALPLASRPSDRALIA